MDFYACTACGGLLGIDRRRSCAAAAKLDLYLGNNNDLEFVYSTSRPWTSWTTRVGSTE